MKRFLLSVVGVLLLAGCVRDNSDQISCDANPDSKLRNWSEDAAKGRLMVRLAEGVAELSIEGLDLDVEPLFPTSKSTKMSRWQLVHFDESLDLMAVAESIARSSDVECVEFDIPMKRIEGQSMPMPANLPEPTRSTTYPFNDPKLPNQWHYDNDGWLNSYAGGEEYCLVGADINLFNAWKYTTGDNRIIVAVMDGGVMVDHEDLKDNLWVNEAEKNGLAGVDDDNNGYIDDIHGYNFVSDNGTITADDHGTHVAGTIAAVNNNGYCGCGIAGGTGKGDGVRIMSLQIFQGKDSCYTSQIARGFEYAADNGAVLINNSWGYEPGGAITSDTKYESYDSVLKNAIDYFESNARMDGVIEGGLAIFAAGNDAYPTATYPGAYYRYTCVSAMSSNFTAATYTNYGPGCNVAAPGGNSRFGTVFCIMSTSTNAEYGYEYMQGTSMATPHVTGCAALALSYAVQKGYTLTNDELRNLILTSTHDINPYQTGTIMDFDFDNGYYIEVDLSRFRGNLGSGYIDAHKLLMQMDGTPCLYFQTGVAAELSLDEFFGGGSKDLTYQSVTVPSDVREALGITSTPVMKEGLLCITCNNPGVGRIKVSAIVGGTELGGGDNTGGMTVERDFEIVVRGAVAENGGWL